MENVYGQKKKKESEEKWMFQRERRERNVGKETESEKR